MNTEYLSMIFFLKECFKEQHYAIDATRQSIHLPAKRNKKYSITSHHIKNWFSENGQLIKCGYTYRT